MTTETTETNTAGADTTITNTTDTTQQTQQSWWSSIDFGDAKETAGTALANYKTPQDLLKALEPKPDQGDWRKAISGGDEKAMKTFERFATIQDAGKAYLDAVNRIRSGELLKPLPADAKPEQIKEYREALGIPENPDGYFEKLPNGLVIGEDDKPLFDGFAKALHELHAPPQFIHKAVEWYYGMQDEQIKAQETADAQGKGALETSLREAWGGDFQANANIYQSFIDSAPEAVREALTTARDIEGNYVLYKPEVVSWLVAQAREINPAGHIVPSAGEGAIASIKSEIESIEKTMRTNRSEYNRNEKMQERYRQLIDARIKLEQRGKAA